MPEQSTLQNPAQLELAERWNSIRWSAGYSSDSLYAFFPDETYADNAGLYASMDNGETWQQVAMGGVQGEVCDVVAHPTNPHILALTSTFGVYMSTDEGESFTQLCDWGDSYVAFDMFNPNLMYYGGQQHFINEMAPAQAMPYSFWHNLILPTIALGVMLTAGITLVTTLA